MVIEFNLFALLILIELLLGEELPFAAGFFDKFGGIDARFDAITRVQHDRNGATK